MNFDDYPALYKSADSGSNKAQAAFLRSIRWEYTILAFLAGVTGSAFFYEGAWAVSLLLSSILIVLLVYRYNANNDVQWYKCRALAESIKTSTWRFCCRSHPYEDCEKREFAVRNFLSELNKIRSDNQFIGEALDESYSDTDQITEKMLELRASSLSERLTYYVDNRVKEQRAWYAQRSGFNKRRKKLWFRFALISYFLVFLFILIDEFSGFNLGIAVNVMLVAITSSIGWLQIKRHGELSASYQLTAHEIGTLLQERDAVETEDQLSEYVNRAEFAFSREHTQWAARSTVI
jgi:hypothetical protein